MINDKWLHEENRRILFTRQKGREQHCDIKVLSYVEKREENQISRLLLCLCKYFHMEINFSLSLFITQKSAVCWRVALLALSNNSALLRMRWVNFTATWRVPLSSLSGDWDSHAIIYIWSSQFDMKEDGNVADFFSSGAKKFLIAQLFAELLAQVYIGENRIYSIVCRPHVTTFTFTRSMWSISLLIWIREGFFFRESWT